MKYVKMHSFREHQMLNDPRFKKAYDRPTKIDKTYDIPYVGGYSSDGKTIYFDRHMKEIFNGKSIIPFLLVHERTEKSLMNVFGLSYQQAHHIATYVEMHAVEKAGLNWRDYSKHIDTYVKLDAHEQLKRVPKDLDLKPYRDERDNRLYFTLAKKEKIQSKPGNGKEVPYPVGKK